MSQVDNIVDEDSIEAFRKKVAEIYGEAIATARNAIAFLPQGLGFTTEELEILRLYLACYHQINRKMDWEKKPEPFLGSLARLLHVKMWGSYQEMASRAYRGVSILFERKITTAYKRFIKKTGLSEDDESAINWRVKIRYTAQSLYPIIRKMEQDGQWSLSPARFEFSLIARDRSAEVIEARKKMVEGAVPKQGLR